MRIDAVAFDVDGTLYPRSLMYRRSVRLAARHPRFVWAFNQVRRTLRRLTHIDDFRRTQARLVAERLGLDPARAGDLVERIIYREWEDMLEGIRPFPHVESALERLRAAGLRLGVMSDYPVKRKLVYLGLHRGWLSSFCSEETGYLKPDRRPFARLAAELDVEPGRILYVGDSTTCDIEGAVAAGMRAARVGRRSPQADFSFKSYRELFDIVVERYR
jgi:putative hydrolase of the HAD superfamily